MPTGTGGRFEMGGATMNVGGAVGGYGSYNPSLNSVRNTQQQQPVGAQGSTVNEMANNSMAQKMMPMQAAESAGRAATEAKGLFVDTYA